MRSTLDKSIEDNAPIMRGLSGYHDLIKDHKIPLNQPEKSILERHTSKLITEEDETYLKQSFEDHLKNFAPDSVSPTNFEYSTKIPKVITTEKAKIQNGNLDTLTP